MKNELIKHGLPAYKEKNFDSTRPKLSTYIKVKAYATGRLGAFRYKDMTIKEAFTSEVTQLTFLMMLIIKIGRENNNAIVIGSFPICLN